MRLKETKDAELVRSSVPIAGENDGYVDAQPEIEDCSNGFAPQPNTTADGSQKMLVPVVLSMTSYLFSHYRLQMYTYLNRSLRNGMLRRIVGFSFTNRIINREVCDFPGANFWRMDRLNFWADVSVTLLLSTADGKREWRGRLSLWFSAEQPGPLTGTIEELTSEQEGPDRGGMIILSPFLVPYFNFSKLDKEAENIWATCIPGALDNPELRKAKALAEAMGLSILHLPLHRHKGVDSILFLIDDEVELSEKGKQPEKRKIPANTIVINTNSIQKEYSDFNILHECIHYYEHYLFFRLQEMHHNDVLRMETQEIALPEDDEKISNPVYWMLQTNRPRVAAYARVSTDQEEQETSFEAQCDYHSRLIRGNPAWEYAGLYTDDGVSATSTARREGFNRLIADALDGKIDRIITKSVSRFARNTVDSLTTIRRLKEKGVGVTFEKENIDTLDSKGELMITIMSSLAQEESRSISENVTWGWRKRIADGKVSMTYGNFLGYERGADGTPVIDEAQARIVRQIYGMFLDGQTPSGIAAALTKQGVPTPTGRANWQSSTVKSILTNEKYKGDALLQKTITVDFLSKAHKVNEGEAPQYFVENSHPAIISREVYDLVQLELQRRGKRGRHTSAKSIFSDRLICGECGAAFGSKVWHSTDPYRKAIWRCNRKYSRKDTKCPI